jgi:sterol desaturase/sphingolipid hydroxylase (fatty acid hydroxylase superfamily)
MDLYSNESLVRIVVFLVVVIVMMLCEFAAPRRPLTNSRRARWPGNLGLMVLNSLLIRLVLPLGAVGVAVGADKSGLGLFAHVSWTPWLVVLLSFLLLDFAIYLQHVLFHFVPILWRLHMVHHADLDFDTTTGVRFHTGEMALSMCIKALAIVLIGASPLSVLLFEIVLNATSLFNHGNVRIPPGLDRLLRLVVVTPDMHRVHHSTLTSETNSNFGFNMPWWDRLLRTYRDQPAKGHDKMSIGLSNLRDDRVERLNWMLAMPFIATDTTGRDRK